MAKPQPTLACACGQDSVIVCTQNIVYQSTRNGIVGLSSMMEKVMPGDDMWTAATPRHSVLVSLVFVMLRISAAHPLGVGDGQRARRGWTPRRQDTILCEAWSARWLRHLMGSGSRCRIRNGVRERSETVRATFDLPARAWNLRTCLTQPSVIETIALVSSNGGSLTRPWVAGAPILAWIWAKIGASCTASCEDSGS